MSSRRRSRFVRSVATSLLLATLTSTFGELARAAEPTRSLVRLSPSFTTANIAEWSEATKEPKCMTLDCVRLRLAKHPTLRMKGEFGRFVGTIDDFGSDTLSGFTVDDEWAGERPAGPVAWSSISSLDMKVSNSGSGAMGGALIGGLLGGILATAIAGAAAVVPSFFGEEPDLAPAVITGVAVGGLLGMGIGVAATSHSTHWEPLYARP